MKRIASIAIVGTLMGGCATTGLMPPMVNVLDVSLLRAGLLDQHVGLVLCVTNPNPHPLKFSRATFTIDVEGQHLGSGQSETPLDIAPGASVPVPFSVVTTTQSLGSQIGEIVAHGGIDYRISGAVALKNFPIAVPYHFDGRLGFNAVTREFRSTPEHSTTSCAGLQSGSPT